LLNVLLPLQKVVRNLIKKHYILSITFVLAVLPLAGLCLIGLRATGASICRICRETNRQALDIPFAELSENSEKYAGQMIRLEAIFVHDSGYTSLRDPTASGVKAMPVGFGKDYVACSSTQNALSFHTGLGGWYDGIAYIRLIGTYGTIDDQRKFMDRMAGFTLLCLEEVKPVDPSKDIPINTVRYAIGQIDKLISYLFGNK
jgi:hypothetical protein